MSTDMRIGAEVNSKDLLIMKSILNLHPEEWVWVESSREADIWIIDFDGNDAPDAIHACCSIGLIKDATPDIDVHHTLNLPLRALEFSKLLDKIMEAVDFTSARKQQLKIPEQPEKPDPEATVAVEETEVAAEQEEPVKDINPWEGRSMMLGKEPNYSAYPITAEMMIWVETMLEEPVSYDDMYENLEYDRELLIAVLNDAAHHGHLTDGDHVAIPEYIKPEGKSALSRLWGK